MKTYFRTWDKQKCCKKEQLAGVTRYFALSVLWLWPFSGATVGEIGKQMDKEAIKQHYMLSSFVRGFLELIIVRTETLPKLNSAVKLVVWTVTEEEIRSGVGMVEQLEIMVMDCIEIETE